LLGIACWRTLGNPHSCGDRAWPDLLHIHDHLHP